MERYDENNQDEEEIFDDSGPAVRLRELARKAELLNHPSVRSIIFDPQELYARAASNFNKHRKGIKKLGALAATTVTAGFATGALVFSHRH